MTQTPRSIPQPSVSYGFSCITVTTVMQENLLSEPHAVRCRVSCIVGAPNHNAGNSIVVGRASPRCLHSPGFGHTRNHRPAGRPRFRGCSAPPVPQTYRRVWLPADSLPVKRTQRPAVLVMRRWNCPEECFQFVGSCPEGGYCQANRAKNPSYAQLHHARGGLPGGGERLGALAGAAQCRTGAVGGLVQPASPPCQPGPGHSRSALSA